MVSPIRGFVKRAVRKLGYEISRAEKTVVPTTEDRKVVNAYYRGHCFKCFQGDCISDFILTGKGWDNQLEGILQRVLGESVGDVVEIGANIGASLIPIATHYPSRTFHCVEPIAEFFNLLKANKESYKAKNVTLYKEAVGATDGDTIEIHVQMGTAGAVPEYDGHLYFGSTKARTTTVDSLFNQMPVALLKLDVDGFELGVLTGAAKTLERYAPTVFMEFHTRLMRQAGTEPWDVAAIFQGLGYDRLSVWDNVGQFITSTGSYADLLTLADSSHCYVDVLFERAKLRSSPSAER